MIGQLVQVCCPSGSSPEWIDSVENSSREVVELRAEVERLQRENLELRQQVGYWQSRHRDTLKRIAALEQKIEQLEGEKRQLQADLFGRRSETKPLKDRSNHLDDHRVELIDGYLVRKMTKKPPHVIAVEGMRDALLVLALPGWRVMIQDPVRRSHR